DTGGSVHASNAVVEAVGDKQVAGAVYGYSRGEIEVCARGRATIAAEAEAAVTGYRGDDAGGSIDAANAGVLGVGDKQVAGAVDRYSRGDQRSEEHTSELQSR